LGREFLIDQFAGNPQGCSRLVGKRLRASESSIRWTDRTRRGEHGAVSIQHYERGVLVREPTKRGKRNHSIRSDHYQSADAVPYTGKATFQARSNPILQNEMAALHAHPDSVAK
jgi:hypothetical protein